MAKEIGKAAKGGTRAQINQMMEDLRRLKAKELEEKDKQGAKGVDMARVRKAADSLRMKHGGKAHKKMKHGGKPHKDMKHGGKAHNEDMMYGGGVGMMKKKKKNGMMGGGKMYASMNQRYANGGKVYPRKGNI